MNTNLIISTLLVTSLAAFPVSAKKDKGNKGKDVPHGLQKKALKGEPLPPGWQKKLSKGKELDQTVYDAGRIVVPIDNKGIVIINVEGKAIKLLKATREIVEILN